MTLDLVEVARLYEVTYEAESLLVRVTQPKRLLHDNVLEVFHTHERRVDLVEAELVEKLVVDARVIANERLGLASVKGVGVADGDCGKGAELFVEDPYFRDDVVLEKVVYAARYERESESGKDDKKGEPEEAHW